MRFRNDCDPVHHARNAAYDIPALFDQMLLDDESGGASDDFRRCIEEVVGFAREAGLY